MGGLDGKVWLSKKEKQTNNWIKILQTQARNITFLKPSGTTFVHEKCCYYEVKFQNAEHHFQAINILLVCDQGK